MSTKGQRWFSDIFTNTDPKARWRITIGLALLISIIHLLSDYLETPHWLFIHSVLTKLYFLPVLIIALWDGERQAYKMSIIVTLFFMPYSVLHWSGPPEGRLSVLSEIVLIWIVSAVAGKLADRLRAVQTEKSRLLTTKEVSKVLEIINRQILIDYEASLGLARSLQYTNDKSAAKINSTESILLDRLEHLGSHLKHLDGLTVSETRPKQKYSVTRLLRESQRSVGMNGRVQLLPPESDTSIYVTIDRTYMTFALYQIIRFLLQLNNFTDKSPLQIELKKEEELAIVTFKSSYIMKENAPDANGAMIKLLSHPEYGYAFSLALSVVRTHGGTF